MDDLETILREELAGIQAEGLYRELRRIDSPQGCYLRYGMQSLINFSSNDYLGLANEPIVVEAAQKTLMTFGVGSGASRLICGSLGPHHVLEEALADFKSTEAALTFSSGYATAMGTIPALLGPGDVIVLDKRVHACVVDAAKLCGAKLRVYAHNDLDDLERKLRWADQRRGASSSAANARRRPRCLVVTESVFSMDGDLAPLREIVALKERYGAWLMIDEAHASGLYGENRRGLAEAFEVGDRIEIQMGTLSKALGASGGYVAGSRALVDFLVNRARTFIFSTAPLPAAAAAATEALRLVRSREGERRRQALWALVDHVKSSLIDAGYPLAPVQSAIIPLVAGAETHALALAEGLRRHGLFVPAIRFPTVPRNQARLRFAVTASHTLEQIEQLQRSLVRLRSEERLSDASHASPGQT